MWPLSTIAPKTPICAASRSSLQSGRYLHNVKSEYPTPGAVVSSGAIHHIDLESKVWPYVFSTTLREHDMGTLSVGDPFVQTYGVIPEGISKYDYDCASDQLVRRCACALPL